MKDGLLSNVEVEGWGSVAEVGQLPVGTLAQCEHGVGIWEKGCDIERRNPSPGP